MQTIGLDIQDGLLKIRQLSDESCIRLHLAGELDLANAKTAEGALDDALASGRHVIVDLAELEFLDSTGVALFVLAMRRAAAGISFLPSRSLEVSRVLQITGVDERMGIARDPEPFSFFSAA